MLLDQGVSPRLRQPLQEALDGVPVESAMFQDWSALSVDELLARARNDGFAILLTTDKRLDHEQAPLTVAVIALDDSRWSTLLSSVDRVATAIKEIGMGHLKYLLSGSSASHFSPTTCLPQSISRPSTLSITDDGAGNTSDDRLLTCGLTQV